jgi:mono/diheme cytochrome c family protein
MLDNENGGSADASRGREARLRSFAIIFIFSAAVAISVAGFTSRATASAAPDNSAGQQTFTTNCVVCHGADGTGSPTGKALKAPDLNSEAVQKMTVAQMEAQVSDGKNNMPPFKSSLTKEQIQGVVQYIRAAFGPKKK